MKTKVKSLGAHGGEVKSDDESESEVLIVRSINSGEESKKKRSIQWFVSRSTC